MHSALRLLSVVDFRSYACVELTTAGAAVYLYGPNGAGKTNLLEAVSLLTPGKGLRGASSAELGRRLPGEAVGRPWVVSASVSANEGDVRLGTGAEPGASRRLVRVDGEPVPPGRLADHVRLVWLTPAQDRLFLEGSTERRKFLDRLVFAAEPAHAGPASAYERAMRERLRLLADGAADEAWLDALETQLGEAGALLAEARLRTVEALQAEIEARTERPFPQADLTLTNPEADAERIRDNLRKGRGRDAAAGRTLSLGPHRQDLLVVHRGRGRPAAEGSTGEQKALLLNLVLAQAARLSRAESAPRPILLLDEVAAHLDRERRAGLFDEILALNLQAFLTGTDEALFEGLRGRALGVRVDASGLHTVE